MADFWIKIEKSTPDKPEILQISSLLNIPDPDTVMGKLVRVWSWFDSNSENGHAPSVTNVLLDRMTGVAGFTDALIAVGWMDKTEDGYYMSNFDRHIGKGAKKRASDAERKRKSRESSEKCPTKSVTKTGLDKSRVDKSRVDNTACKEAISKGKQIDKKYIEIARQLSIVAIRRIPSLDYKEKKWGDDVRKIIEIDGKSQQELFAVWSYIDQHENNGFSWGDNIRTPGKLRAKKDGLSYYDKIVIDMKRGSANGQNRPRQHVKETPLERMARKQRSMDMRSAPPEYYDQILGENDTIVSTQMGIDRRGSPE